MNVIGLILEFDVQDDGAQIQVSTASVLKLRIKNPSGDVLNPTATYVIDVDGERVQYTTILDDIKEEGLHEIQVYMEIGSWTGFSSVVKIYANPNL